MTMGPVSALLSIPNQIQTTLYRREKQTKGGAEISYLSRSHHSSHMYGVEMGTLGAAAKSLVSCDWPSQPCARPDQARPENVEGALHVLRSAGV